MMIILNRLRGTIGVWSKVIGLLLALIVEMVYHNPYVTIAVGLGYIIGESFGWGLWLGSIAERDDGYSLYLKGEREGANNGIHWLASHIVEPTKETWLNYCRVAMVIRGFVWWIVPMIGLWFVGFNPYMLLACLIFLSIGFPLACELGYYSAKRFSYQREGFSIVGGWEHQEVWYGLMQDLVIITLVGASLWH